MYGCFRETLLDLRDKEQNDAALIVTNNPHVDNCWKNFHGLTVIPTQILEYIISQPLKGNVVSRNEV